MIGKLSRAHGCAPLNFFFFTWSVRDEFLHAKRQQGVSPRAKRALLLAEPKSLPIGTAPANVPSAITIGLQINIVLLENRYAPALLIVAGVIVDGQM